ncbi:MAG TPA: sigma-70 family RNA polymerase sigma factor [Baekduia sp.]|nr:sigma-70 family RNA polymerase sigma factor [Baekduia sp.]
MKTQRADVLLVEKGLASTRSQAQRLIASGVQWRLGAHGPWSRVAKNGEEIPAQAELQLQDAAEARFVSRGGLKLDGVLESLGLAVQGLQCLDVGQSTGGFTHCLLERGARRVVGVDVGHGQLHAQLRQDPRVVCLEGINARALTPEMLQMAWEDAWSEPSAAAVEDELGDTLGSVETGFARAEDRALISRAAAGLPLRDRKVLALYFVSDLTQRQIADEIGVSQMQVSRILGRAVEQLKSAAVR